MIIEAFAFDVAMQIDFEFTNKHTSLFGLRTMLKVLPRDVWPAFFANPTRLNMVVESVVISRLVESGLKRIGFGRKRSQNFAESGRFLPEISASTPANFFCSFCHGTLPVRLDQFA